MQPFFTPTLTLPRQGGGWFVTFYEVVNKDARKKAVKTAVIK
jgi:hypothetical protein